MTKPKVGTKLTYSGSDALGQSARINDPDVDETGQYDSPQLDMQPGTEVEVVGYDDERGLTLVQWEDVDGNPRTTSIESLDGFTRG